MSESCSAKPRSMLDIMTKRPEQLTIAQFVELTNLVENELKNKE